MDVNALPLARAALDRNAQRRSEPGLLDLLRAAPATPVVLVRGGRVATVAGGDGLRLDTPPAHEVDGDGLWVYLGDLDGPYLAYLATAEPDDAGTPQAGAPEPADVAGGARHWASLREVGAELPAEHAALATTAIALAGWHAGNPRCPRCGAPTEPVQAGWVRRCTQDGSEHYPRTDPAVIMAVVDGEDRLLLGHGVLWPRNRFSTLAGYVEPGESLEQAVRREVAEEASVVVGRVSYQGSQPWPFPASLMLAFRAEALTTGVAVDGEEVTEARWFSRAELAAAVAAGEVMLPARTSVARALIEDWYGGILD